MVVNEHRRILVVDDERQITRVLRTSLSSQGYDLRVANDGETALEIMKDWTPDLVITDLSMPNMVYDSKNKVTLLFGGQAGGSGDGVNLNETWAYSYERNTWEKRSPKNPPFRR